MKTRPLLIAIGLACALAITAMSVTLVSRRTQHRTVPAAVSQATPIVSSTPSPSLAPPPAGVDLLWRTTAENSALLDALDWNGVVRGHLLLPATLSNISSVIPSSDGQRLLVGLDQHYHVLTAQGQDLGVIDASREPFPVDDFSQFCDLQTSDGPQGGSASLSLLGLNRPARAVATFSWSEQGDGGARLVACSVHSDLAVISVAYGDDSAGHVTELRVVRLSTGRTLRLMRPASINLRGGPTPGALSNVAASEDGRLLALIPYTGIMDNSSPVTTDIVDTVTGRLLGRVQGAVTGFTAEGFAETLRGAIDWRTGRVMLAPPRCCDGLVAVQPDGTGAVVAVPGGPPPTAGTAEHPAEYPPDDFLLIRADGTTVKLACCEAHIL